MTTTPTTIEELLDYWPGNIPFKGRLVSTDGCMCAQGQVLHFLGGLTADELQDLQQDAADRQVSKLLDISLAHSILLRVVNDNQDGAPSIVLRKPERVLGDQAQTVLTFWRHIDRISGDSAAWEAAGRAADSAAWAAAWAAAALAASAGAGEVAGKVAWEVAWAAAREGDWDAAREGARAAGGLQMKFKAPLLCVQTTKHFISYRYLVSRIQRQC